MAIWQEDGALGPVAESETRLRCSDAECDTGLRDRPGASSLEKGSEAWTWMTPSRDESTARARRIQAESETDQPRGVRTSRERQRWKAGSPPARRARGHGSPGGEWRLGHTGQQRVSAPQVCIGNGGRRRGRWWGGGERAAEVRLYVIKMGGIYEPEERAPAEGGATGGKEGETWD